MLMDIKCSAVTSIRVNLTFDDQCHKNCVIGVGDLIDCEYNANGLRKHIVGKVISVSAIGFDPKGWYIIVDGSDDFEGAKARFSPMNILDVEILRKADMERFIETPRDDKAVPYLRIVKGRLQYSKNGFDYFPVKVDSRDVIEEIEDQNGTVPVSHHNHHNNCNCNCNKGNTNSEENTTDPEDAFDDPEIEDSNS